MPGTVTDIPGPKQKATLQCSCGKCEIILHNPKPVKCLECCCIDCRVALQWTIKQKTEYTLKKNDNEKHVIKNIEKMLTKPLKLHYFENAIEIVKGKEHLTTWKLRMDSESTRLVAECCWTNMLVDHWFYFKEVVMVPGGGKLTFPNQPVPPEFRIQTKWWKGEMEEKHGKLPENDGIKNYVCDDFFWAIYSGMAKHFMLDVKRTVRKTKDIVTLQNVIGSLGYANIINAPVPELDGHIEMLLPFYLGKITIGWKSFQRFLFLTFIFVVYVSYYYLVIEPRSRGGEGG